MQTGQDDQRKTPPDACDEMPMRRYAHPVAQSAAVPAPAALHYISSALSYQNQLLAELLSVAGKILERLPDKNTEDT